MENDGEAPSPGFSWDLSRLGFRAWDLEFWVEGLGFRAWDLEFWVEDLGLSGI